ncbi:MAG TPA: NAD-dependent epimerase/dehydratase family protein [Solirubrobacteraceae bacterium]|nr:NAD-dependent epimerase/dehydratase family protein [Solirubrobacteraceae bacterium]
MDASLSRVAVTGAGGFIGAAVCRRLAGEGVEVAGLDLPGTEERVRATGAGFAACDVTDAPAVAQALRGVPHVVHTAAIVSDWGPMDAFVRVNVDGTRNVLDAARDAERVVHVSSVAIWGHDFDHDVHEDSEPRPSGDPYVDTKGASDVLARTRGATVVRPGDVYGPGSTPWAIRPLAGLRSRRLAVPPRGVMTPVYIDDLVELIRLALVHPDAAGRAFVGWEGPPVAVRDFFDRYARMAGRRRAPVLPLPVLKVAAAADEGLARLRGRAPTATRWAVSYLARTAAYRASRAQEVLGWRPRVGLDEGMRRTEAWARAEGLLD